MSALGDKTVLKLNEAKALYSAASTANTAFYADAVGGDYKVLITFANAAGSDGDVTITKGDGPMAAQKDLTFEVANGATKGIVIDSALYKIFTGTNKNKYKITTTKAMTVMVAELPQ